MVVFGLVISTLIIFRTNITLRITRIGPRKFTWIITERQYYFRLILNYIYAAFTILFRTPQNLIRRLYSSRTFSIYITRYELMEEIINTIENIRNLSILHLCHCRDKIRPYCIRKVDVQITNVDIL